MDGLSLGRVHRKASLVQRSPVFVLLLFLLPQTIPGSIAEESALAAPYVAHGPLACVDGQLVPHYEGLDYDASLVQGSGTSQDPYILQGVAISLTTYASHLAGLVLVRCPHFHLLDSRIDGYLDRDPACRGPDGVQEGETANHAILSVDSPGLRVEDSIVRYGRLAGLYLEGGEARVLRSDITSNFGTGVRATGGAWLNLTENYIAYNGWFMPESPPTREGRIHPTWAAGVYLDGGAYVEAFNNSLYRNENAVNIDKSLDVTTNGVLNYNTIEASDWAAIVVVGLGEENRMGWCTENGAPPWWGVEEAPPEPEPEQQHATAASHWGAPTPSAGLPLYEEVPDSEEDPLHVVNVRLNFWGQFNGPGPLDTQGKADYRFWLPTESPRVALAGAAREHGHARDYDTILRYVETTLRPAEEASQELLP